MARVLKGSHSFTWTPRVHRLTEWTIPAFAFPAEAGTHLPIPEGWKAELALGSVDYSMYQLAREGVQNTHHQSGRSETATENGVSQAGSCCHCISHCVNGITGSSRSVLCVLYIFSCNISYLLLSTELKSGEFGGHSWGGINSGVFFCAQWAFQVVETLFRWGEKNLHHLAANLFRRRRTKFCHHLLSFIRHITTKYFRLFSGHIVYVCAPQESLININYKTCSSSRKSPWGRSRTGQEQGWVTGWGWMCMLSLGGEPRETLQSRSSTLQQNCDQLHLSTHSNSIIIIIISIDRVFVACNW